MSIISNYIKNAKSGLHLYNDIKEKGATYFETDFPKAGALVSLKGEKSITIEGVAKRWKREAGKYVLIPFSKTFKIGDTIETGSWNFIYINEITKISAKTVTYKDGGRDKRINLIEFIKMNWNFDIERINKHNFNESFVH